MVQIINDINNTIGASNSGVTNLLTIQNPDNSSSSSHAQNLITVGGTSAGNPWAQWTVGTSQSYAMGMANTVGTRSLVINGNNSASVSPSTGTNLWTMTTAGIRTIPLQPAFFVVLSNTINNATGDGTIYTVPFNTTIFDRQSNYNSGSSDFTAPVDGAYLFTTAINMRNLSSSHTTGTLSFLKNGTEYIYGNTGGAYAQSSSPNGTLTWVASIVYPMSAGDTMASTISVGPSSKTVNITANQYPSAYQNYFSGALLF